ncbi:hypothetical protein [Paenibacillus ehimensis]|uniref:Uncharacterized protein n=1 Tax=Paenibacillus ehimensis TaxID=79264 RepID=A0ABT8VMM3_9BACL|nr:hypothetical protein [Paenibacillus ehimensis]MDO3682201.1 hypothetical protein [Paenibacillus ehimensis]
MSKFKSSTHAQIDQTIKELLRPPLEVGRTYKIRGCGIDGKSAVVKRTVIDLDKTHVTYLKHGEPKKCQITTFQRIYAEHGIQDDGGEQG